MGERYDGGRRPVKYESLWDKRARRDIVRLMKLIAVSVGGPREVDWRGRIVRTSIFKTPVAGRVHVGRLNLDGDEQSDLSVHGGAEKAVYAYPAEHYAWWRAELSDDGLAWPAFGENFTTEGLLEEEVCIGDRYRAGTAEFVVTQPRTPCYKLGVRFKRADMVKRFQHSGRSGFYLAVTREGEVGAGDAIEPIATKKGGLTVADVVGLYATDATNQSLLERASQDPGLPASWRDYFRQRLWKPDA
jgi:MOSC domain-containing protein YiiM